MGGVAVVSAVIGAAGIGILLGLSLRVPAVLGASAAIVLTGVATMLFTDVRASTAGLTTLASLVTLQCGYLFGLALLCAWSRVRGTSLSARDTVLTAIGPWTEGPQSSQAG